MESSYRYADEATANAYPQDVAAQSPWQSNDGKLHATFAIPPCPKAHIIVPSLAIDNMPYQYQCSLDVAGERWSLEPVPSRPPVKTNAKSGPPKASCISTHIDCYHTETDIEASALTPAIIGATKIP